MLHMSPGCTSSNDGSACCVNTQLSVIPIVVLNSFVTGATNVTLAQCRSAGALLVNDRFLTTTKQMQCMGANLLYT